MQGRLSCSSGGLDGVNALPHRISTSGSRDPFESSSNGYSNFSIPHTSQSMEYPSQQQQQQQQHSLLHHSSSGIGVYDSGGAAQQQQQHLRIPRGGSHAGNGSSSDRLTSNPRGGGNSSSDRLHIPRGGSHSGSTDRLPAYSGVDELTSQFTEGLSLRSSSREFDALSTSPPPPQLSHLSQQQQQQQQLGSVSNGVRRSSSSGVAGIGSGGSREWSGLLDVIGATASSSSSGFNGQQRPSGGW
jgi:hypothetical protein